MDKVKLSEDLGKKILQTQHEFYVDSQGEDLDYITNIKRIVGAISEFLKSEGAPEGKINSTVKHIKDMARSFQIDEAISQKDEAEDEKDIRKESTIWFDYIYENDEYPR